MSNCYICENEITEENKSREHIILNAIGGRLKSYDLLCNKCNSKIGSKADASLAEQLNFLSSQLQVKRDSGVHPVLKGGKTKGGEEYLLKDGRTPVSTKPKFEQFIDKDGNAQLNITARNEAELNKILKAIYKKHGDPFTNKKVEKETLLYEPLNYTLSVGGELSLQSITKTAVNFYLHTNGDRKNIQHLIPYIQGDKKQDVCRIYTPLKSIYKKDENEVLHLVTLVAHRHSKSLCCYVEFFSTVSFLILLSDKYEGKSYTKTYAYNLISGQEVQKKIKLKLQQKDFYEIADNLKKEAPVITGRLKRVMRIACKIQKELHRKNMFLETFKEVASKYDSNVITKEMLDEFTRTFVNRYVHYLAYRRKKLS